MENCGHKHKFQMGSPQTEKNLNIDLAREEVGQLVTATVEHVEEARKCFIVNLTTWLTFNLEDFKHHQNESEKKRI